jgi:hypothetical protein
LPSTALSLPAFTFDAPLRSTPFDTMVFRLVVTDAGGLSSAAECSVQVLDVTAPVITGARSITAEAQSAAGATVSFDLSALDAVDGTVPVSCSPASGSTFPLATTAVTCSAADSRQNTAQVSFDVVVVDTTPPTLTVPGDITAAATSAAGAVVTFSATAADAVAASATVTCTPASGSLFPVGSTRVGCTATDTVGNSSTGSFYVAVGAPNADCTLGDYPRPKGVYNLKNANLSGCYLAGAALAKASASGANLTGTYLAGASLAGADLSKAILRRAVLTNADLSSAKLSFADLTGALLTGANVTGVTWSQAICPDGTTASSHGNTCADHL